MTIFVGLSLFVALWVAFAFWVVTLIWQWKSHNSYACRVAQFITSVVITAIAIGLLTVALLNGESYGFQLFLSYAWLLIVAINAFSLKKN